MSVFLVAFQPVAHAICLRRSKCTNSSDHLISSLEYFDGNRYPNRVGGFEIDGQLIFERHLDRQILGFDTSQNLARIPATATADLIEIESPFAA